MHISKKIIFIFAIAGDPISCINDGSIPMHVINTFCWITYTFTIPGQQHRQIGTDVASPGLGNEYGQEKRYHSYYQWVPFVLFFQVSDSIVKRTTTTMTSNIFIESALYL